MIDERTLRLAVLIDAENTSAKIAPELFGEIAKIGEASVRRIYGDFFGDRLKSWTEILTHYAIIPCQQSACTKYKNASDIALVIDAMDLLHSGRFNGFCLVSSDSDFTRLAARIREQGIDVFGFGEKKTPESFRRACRRFTDIENRGADEVSSGEILACERAKSALPLFEKAISNISEEDSWVGLAHLGKMVRKLDPDFSGRYGQGSLSNLVKATGAFEHKGEGTSRHAIRRKKAPSKNSIKKG